MAIFPCEVKSLCFDLASPFANFSAEAPDREIFVGFSTGFGPLYPPLGDTFLAAGCVRFCESDVSQEEANLCADRQVVECLSVKWPVYRPGVDVFGNPVPVPENRQIFFNRAQSATVQCPDGNPFIYTVAAGTYSAFSQVEADQAAASRAAQLAAESIVCISSLATRTCVNEPYASSVTATGSHLDPGTTCWDILGVLPAGIESDLDTVFGCRTGSNTLHFFGNPTVPGFYSFAIQVQDGLGNFMVKPVTMQIIGITTTSLPDGTPFVLYSAFIDAGGVTNPIFALESGTLPAGLAFDTASGEIFGTPIQAELQTLTFSVTEAGTGITCVADPISLEIVGPSDCENTPTNSVTHNDTVGFYNSLGIVPNDKYMLACEGFTPSMELFDISGGAIVSLATQTPNFSFGRIVWSPLANEWVHVGQDAGTQTQVWFTSYNKTTLVQTGQDQSTNVLGTNTFQQQGIVCSPTTGIVYASCGNTGQIRTYNSLTHLVGPLGAVPNACLGSMGLNDSANRLYVANGANNSVAPPNKAAVVTVYNATTLAVVNTFALPINGIAQGYVRGCTFNPDDGLLYVAGNDENADGGDVLWVMNPTTGAIVNTIRLLTSGLKSIAIDFPFYPTALTYDSSTHQIYMFFGNNLIAPGRTRGGVQIICCDSQTKVALLTPSSDPNQGLFLGDVAFGTVVTVAPPESTDVIMLADSFNGLIREYTFP